MLDLIEKTERIELIAEVEIDGLKKENMFLGNKFKTFEKGGLDVKN